MPASAQETADLTEDDVSVLKELTGVKETPNIVFHFRPADVDDKRLAEVVQVNLDNFAACKELLKMDYKGRVHIFLYRDIDDLQKTTGAGAVAFSRGMPRRHRYCPAGTCFHANKFTAFPQSKTTPAC